MREQPVSRKSNNTPGTRSRAGGGFHTASLAGLATLVIGVGLLPVQAWSAAWTRPQGTALFSLPVTYQTADKVFDADGNRVDIPKFEMTETAPYFEYGALDSLTIGLQPKYRDVKVELPDGGHATNSGLAETDVFFRKRMWGEGDAAFSLQGLVKFPNSPEENDPAALGRDQHDYELSLLYGNRHHTDNGAFVYNVDFGYRYRAEDPDDQVHANAYAGWSGSKFTFLVTSQNTFGLTTPSVESNQVLTEFRTFSAYRVGFVTSYRVTDNFGVSANASRVYGGEGIGAIGAVGLSAFATW